jgi:peptide/nickel transport system substrate-binding protein
MKRRSPLLALCLFLISAACGRNPGQKETVFYGLTLAPTGIDPHINASSELGIPLSSVYDTLVFQDPQSGEFVPGLAERWTISEDGLVYTFFLRNDVVFHDGTLFDAQAVEENIAYILNPEHASQKASIMLGPLDHVTIVNDFTISFHLKEPFAPLLDSLAQVYLGMASPTALKEWGVTDYQFHQVGTGPYRFVEYIPNDHITLERNPDYAWGPTIYQQSSAAIDEIVFRFYADPATRSLALESGEADIIGEVPPQDAARLAATGDFQLYPIPIPGQPLQMFFNIQHAPTDDVRMREALIQAIDRKFIVETVFGPYSPVAEGPLSACTLGYEPASPYPEFDPEAAAETLDQLGWRPQDPSGLRMRDGKPLQLNIIVPNWGSNPEVGQLIQAAWINLGAEVNLEVAAGFGPLKQAQSAGAYHLIGINFFGSDPDLLRPFYHSQGLYNWSGVNDPRIDEILTIAVQASADLAERQIYYTQLAEIIRQQALILPIRDYVNLVISRTGLEGLRFSSQGWFPFLIDLRLKR